MGSLAQGQPTEYYRFQCCVSSLDMPDTASSQPAPPVLRIKQSLQAQTSVAIICSTSGMRANVTKAGPEARNPNDIGKMTGQNYLRTSKLKPLTGKKVAAKRFGECSKSCKWNDLNHSPLKEGASVEPSYHARHASVQKCWGKEIEVARLKFWHFHPELELHGLGIGFAEQTQEIRKIVMLLILDYVRAGHSSQGLTAFQSIFKIA